MYYSRDGGISWDISGGGYPSSGVYWDSIASSSNGQVVVAGCLMDSGPGKILVYLENRGNN
jgi:hypothetical protein